MTTLPCLRADFRLQAAVVTAVGVGGLVRMAVALGRKTRPTIKQGISIVAAVV